MDLADIFSGAISPAKWRALGEFLGKSRITGGQGVRVRQVAGQTIISARREGRCLLDSYRHPFQIFAAEVSGNPVIRVADGAFTVQSWFTNGNTIECNALEDPVLIGGGSLGVDSGDGYLSVSPSTTYGVFVVAKTLATSGSAFTNGTGYPGKIRIYDPIIAISSSNTTASSLNAMTSAGTYAGYCGWFLGTVAVDAGGAMVISHHRKSDISVVEPAWVYQTIVSADTSGGTNSITPGSDGGAYYVEP
jgi:hypothetical protein